MRLGLSNSDFPDTALKLASDALRTVDPCEPARILNREACLRVPFLVLAIDEVDRLNETDPEKAVGFAQVLVTLAESIPVRDGGMYYISSTERRDFVLLTRAVFMSALAYAGRPDEAKAAGQKVLAGAKNASLFVLAEAERRYALVLAEFGRLEQAIEMCSLAFDLFEAEGRADMAGLCALRRGTFRNVLFGRGSGSADYALATWLSTNVRRDKKAARERADRVGLAASLNLVRDFRDSSMSDDRETLKFVVGVRSRITRPSRTKTTALMLEGLITARLGAHRHGMRLLVRALKEYLSLKSFCDAAVCVAEVLEISLKWEPESVDKLTVVCEEILSRVAPEQTRWLVQWLAAAKPSASRIEELRAETLARHPRCPARAARADLRSSPV